MYFLQCEDQAKQVQKLFHSQGEAVRPTLGMKLLSVKSLCRWYDASIKDSEQEVQLRQEAVRVESTDRTAPARQVEALLHAAWISSTPHVATYPS